MNDLLCNSPKLRRSTDTKVVTKEQKGCDDKHRSVVYLGVEGKLFNKNVLQKSHSGVIAEFLNYPVRNKNWVMSSSCFHGKTGSFAAADERGQVFVMNIPRNAYQSVRLASTNVSSMAFVEARKHHLVVAYENSVVVLIDTNSKNIIGNLQSKNGSPVRLIASHPALPLILMAHDDMSITLWDLSCLRCTQTLDCNEPIVQISFELKGSAISVTLERSGIFIYSSSDCVLLSHLAIPATERGPLWTASCSYPVSSSSRNTTDSSQFNFIAAGDNSMLYSWFVDFREFECDQSLHQHVDNYLVGLVEIPVKMRSIVNMLHVGEDVYPPRLVMQSADGFLLIVDVEGFRARRNASRGHSASLASIGRWAILSDLSSSCIHSRPSEGLLLSRVAVGGTAGHSRTTQHHRHNHHHTRSSAGPVALEPPPYVSCNALGRLAGAGDYICVVGVDGAARLLDIQAMLGLGELNGSSLRTRLQSNSASSANEAGSVEVVHSSKSYASRQTGQKENVACSSSVAFTPCTAVVDNNNNGVAHYIGATKPTQVPVNANDYVVLTSTSAQVSSKQNRSTTATVMKQNEHKKRSIMSLRKPVVDNVKHSSSSSSDPDYAASFVSGKTQRVPVHHKTSNIGQSIARSATKDRTVNGSNQHQLQSKHSASHESPPLFELALLTPREKQMNLEKLKRFLREHGEFPARYRPLIWRFLLKLPENSQAFSDLVKRGVHSSYESLHDIYPLQSKIIFSRLQNICSQLAHWAPVLGDAPYIPSMVFPFVLLFGADELAALEVAMSVMMWWGHSFHTAHPNPPLHLMDALDALLKFHDLKLYNHFQRLNISVGALGWSLISSLFTEVLCRGDWLKLMDFLFCHFEEIAYILLLPVSILRELKQSLLTSDSASKVTQYCRTQQGVHIDVIIATAKELLHTTPPKYLTAVSTKFVDNTQFETGANSLHKDVQLESIDEARENLALGAGKPMFPLPKFRYPIYDGFPKKLFDLQIRERERVLSLTQEVSRREGVLRTLEKKLAEAESDHRRWIDQHSAASEQELKYQQELMTQEKIHLRELQRIEEDISIARIKALGSLEQAEKEEMHVMDKVAEDSQKLLHENEKHMKEKMEISLSLQKHRELAELAELATQEKLRRLRMVRARDDWVKGMAQSMKNKEQEMSARDRILQERWSQEDDEVKRARLARADAIRKLEEEEKLAGIQWDMNQRIHHLEIEREAKIIEVERTRAVRLAKEATEEALASSDRSAAVLRRHELEKVSHQKSMLTVQQSSALEEKLMDSIKTVTAESNKLIDSERIHRLKEAQARLAARDAALQEEWAVKSKKELLSALSVQGQLQDEALRLRQASMKNEAYAAALNSLPVTWSDDDDGHYSTQNKAARDEIEALGVSVLQQQKDRFAGMKQYLDTIEIDHEPRAINPTVNSRQPDNKLCDSQDASTHRDGLTSVLVPNNEARSKHHPVRSRDIKIRPKNSSSSSGSEDECEIENDCGGAAADGGIYSTVEGKLAMSNKWGKALSSSIADPSVYGGGEGNGEAWIKASTRRSYRQSDSDSVSSTQSQSSATEDSSFRQSDNESISDAMNAAHIALQSGQIKKRPLRSGTGEVAVDTSSQSASDLEVLAHRAIKSVQQTRHLNREERTEKGPKSAAAPAVLLSDQTANSTSALWDVEAADGNESM